MQTGQKIAELRIKAGMTQEEFASELYVSRELVSKWETGKRIPDDNSIEMMCSLLGVSHDCILDRDERIIEELSDCFPTDLQLPTDEIISLINSFLSGLSEKERNIFISRYYYHHHSAETAELLSLREGSIRKTLMKLRKKLSQYIKENTNG